MAVSDLFEKKVKSLVSQAVTYRYVSQEKKQKKIKINAEVDVGDFEKKEHGSLLLAVPRPSL